VSCCLKATATNAVRSVSGPLPPHHRVFVTQSAPDCIRDHACVGFGIDGLSFDGDRSVPGSIFARDYGKPWACRSGVTHGPSGRGNVGAAVAPGSAGD
jgi:hypothetical protein